jgi:hypothetical protein
MAITKGTAIDNNHFWRFNYPADGFIFDLKKMRFALYKRGDFTDEQLARSLTLDLMFFPKRVEALNWKSELKLIQEEDKDEK